jgi:hypothetical protein
VGCSWQLHADRVSRKKYDGFSYISVNVGAHGKVDYRFVLLYDEVRDKSGTTGSILYYFTSESNAHDFVFEKLEV